MRAFFFVLIAIILIALTFFASCTREQDQLDALRLQRWDALCDSLPEAISDSLNGMDPGSLSSSNRARHGLLSTITHDKMRNPFTSDSLINSVEQYYNRHDQESDHHIRSLIYQGIVRIRMGVADSTVYEPLKKALTVLDAQQDPNPILLYFANFYLGYVHSEHDNDNLAYHYYRQALANAREYNNDSHLVSIYQRLFKMRMYNRDYDNARLYLDTIATYARTVEDKFYLSSAEALYLDKQGAYPEALEKTKERLRLAQYLKEDPEYFRIYYSLSDNYSLLNRLDSALYYGREAIVHIQDSTYRSNYLLYENIADIAVRMNDYQLADNYRQQALKAYSKSVKVRIDTQIHELEKKYDLAESENRALKFENRFRFLLLLSFFGLNFTLILFFYYRKQRAFVRLEREKTEEKIRRVDAEKLQAEAESRLSREQAENQQQLLSKYNAFLKFHAEQQQQIQDMSNKIRSTNSKLGDVYEGMIRAGKREFNQLVDELFTEEDMWRLFDIHDTQGVLTRNDRLMLFMLANNASNSQLAALLNITTANLKAQKSQLKKKIIDNRTIDNGFQGLESLF